MALEKILESPSYSKEIKPVSPKGNQAWIFIGRTDAEADAPILCHLMWRTDSLEKTLMLGKTEGKRRRGKQRLRSLGSITYSLDMNLSKLWEIVKNRGAWRAAVHGVSKSQIWLSDWTTTTKLHTLWNNWLACLCPSRTVGPFVSIALLGGVCCIQSLLSALTKGVCSSDWMNIPTVFILCIRLVD